MKGNLKWNGDRVVFEESEDGRINVVFKPASKPRRKYLGWLDRWWW